MWGKHNQQTCQLKSETCHFCNKCGHIAKVCKSKKRQLPPSKPTHQVRQDPPDSVPLEYNLFTVPSQQSKPLQVVINIEGNPLTMGKWILELQSPLSATKLGTVSLIFPSSHFNLTQLHSKPTQKSLFLFWGNCPSRWNTMARIPP